jgi:DNA gyrase/topoisomerase IV subunit A
MARNKRSSGVRCFWACGVVLRTKVKDITRSGRATRGVMLMNLQPGDAVASVARVSNSALLNTDAPDKAT